jgi:hypothetical protein
MEIAGVKVRERHALKQDRVVGIDRDQDATA